MEEFNHGKIEQVNISQEMSTQVSRLFDECNCFKSAS